MIRKVNAGGPKLVSLFSGCGGMDIGFEQAGFYRVWANDFDKDAQATFRANLGDIDGRDIRDVPAEEIPDCDIITAGFPSLSVSKCSASHFRHISRSLV